MCGGWHRHGQDHHAHDEEGLRLSDKGFMALTLDVLKDNPGTGYDVVNALEERLGGLLAAGPGNIYPVLQLLEDAGYVRRETVEERKTFAITEAGLAYLAERQEGLDAFWARVERGRYKEAVWEAIGDLKSLAWEVRATVRERRLEKAQLTAIQEAIAQAREVIEKNLAG